MGYTPDGDGHHPGLPRNSWFSIGMGAMFLLSALGWGGYEVGLVTLRRLTGGTGSHVVSTGTQECHRENGISQLGIKVVSVSEAKKGRGHEAWRQRHPDTGTQSEDHVQREGLG